MFYCMTNNNALFLSGNQNTYLAGSNTFARPLYVKWLTSANTCESDPNHRSDMWSYSIGCQESINPGPGCHSYAESKFWPVQVSDSSTHTPGVTPIPTNLGIPGGGITGVTFQANDGYNGNDPQGRNFLSISQGSYSNCYLYQWDGDDVQAPDSSLPLGPPYRLYDGAKMSGPGINGGARGCAYDDFVGYACEWKIVNADGSFGSDPDCGTW